MPSVPALCSVGGGAIAGSRTIVWATGARETERLRRSLALAAALHAPQVQLCPRRLPAAPSRVPQVRRPLVPMVPFLSETNTLPSRCHLC